jgi:hypothetical protein
MRITVSAFFCVHKINAAINDTKHIPGVLSIIRPMIFNQTNPTTFLERAINVFVPERQRAACAMWFRIRFRYWFGVTQV